MCVPNLRTTPGSRADIKDKKKEGSCRQRKTGGQGGLSSTCMERTYVRHFFGIMPEESQDELEVMGRAAGRRGEGGDQHSWLSFPTKWVSYHLPLE